MEQPNKQRSFFFKFGRSECEYVCSVHKSVVITNDLNSFYIWLFAMGIRVDSTPCNFCIYLLAVTYFLFN